jgi:hypothetical protein
VKGSEAKGHPHRGVGLECTLLRVEPGGAEYTTVAIEHKKDDSALAAVIVALQIASLEPAARVAFGVRSPAPRRARSAHERGGGQERG